MKFIPNRHHLLTLSVVAGSPHEPMTRSIAHDLERRGYIVYITVSSSDEERIVQSENRADIHALWIDLTVGSCSFQANELLISSGPVIAI